MLITNKLVKFHSFLTTVSSHISDWPSLRLWPVNYFCFCRKILAKKMIRRMRIHKLFTLVLVCRWHRKRHRYPWWGWCLKNEVLNHTFIYSKLKQTKAEGKNFDNNSNFRLCMAYFNLFLIDFFIIKFYIFNNYN